MSEDKNIRRTLFNQEVETLKRFSENGQDHIHLIKLLATYQHGEDYHLIFPWSDGNLRDFWKTWHSPQMRTHGLARWFAREMLSIAKGLDMIHTGVFESSSGQGEQVGKDAEHRRGIHGDITPENILWFRDYEGRDDPNELGLLKISDFGFSRFHRKESSKETKPRGLGYSKTSRAPEMDLEKPISRSYDIWALGCLYLEFVTWFVRGFKGTEDFMLQRYNSHLDFVREDSFFNVIPIREKAKYGACLKGCVKAVSSDLLLAFRVPRPVYLKKN